MQSLDRGGRRDKGQDRQDLLSFALHMRVILPQFPFDVRRGLLHLFQPATPGKVEIGPPTGKGDDQTEGFSEVASDDTRLPFGAYVEDRLTGKAGHGTEGEQAAGLVSCDDVKRPTGFKLEPGRTLITVGKCEVT